MRPVAGDRQRLVEVGHVEVAHAPREDLALALELLEGGDGVLERVRRRASAGGSSPAGRCAAGRASARRPPASRAARRSRAGPSRRGTPRRAGPRSPRPTMLLARPAPYISAVSMWVMPRSRPRRNAAIAVGGRRPRCTRSLARSPATSRWVGPKGQLLHVASSGEDLLQPSHDLRFGLHRRRCGRAPGPSSRASRVGMLRTLKRAAVAGDSSTLSFATRTRPAISDASSSSIGAIIRHGPHQGAHRSSSTGSGERSTSASNVASVTVTGFSETGSGFLHRPQTGSSPASTRSHGTRLVAPQAGQQNHSCHGPLLFLCSPRPPAHRPSLPGRPTSRLHEPLATVRARMLEHPVGFCRSAATRGPGRSPRAR